jgi:hypothetical protein
MSHITYNLLYLFISIFKLQQISFFVFIIILYENYLITYLIYMNIGNKMMNIIKSGSLHKRLKLFVHIILNYIIISIVYKTFNIFSI